MEIINAVIENTNSPEIQAILAKLNPEEDILFTNEKEDRSSIVVEYIEPINNIKVIGNIPDDIINTIREKYGKDASIDIYDYVITYDQGVYSLAVDIEVDTVETEKPVKEKKATITNNYCFRYSYRTSYYYSCCIKTCFFSQKK